MAQFFGIEDIKDLTKASQTTIEWASGSNLRIGGQAYNVTSVLTLDTATDIDTGAIASDTIYYIYAVVVAGVVSLKYSLSDSAPTGYSAYRLIGSFFSNSISEVEFPSNETNSDTLTLLDQEVPTGKNTYKLFVNAGGTVLDNQSDGSWYTSTAGNMGDFQIFLTGFTVAPHVHTTVQGQNGVNNPEEAYVFYSNSGEVRIQCHANGIGTIARDTWITVTRAGADFFPNKKIRDIIEGI